MSKTFALQKLLLRSSALFLLSAFICMGTACSKSDDQKKFEEEALRLPENITETDAGGKINENKKDPDDWRISPRYSGLITIGEPLTQLPYPNPLPFNQKLTLQIDLRSIQNLSRIEIYVLDLSASNPLVPLAQQAITSTPALIEFKLEGQLISGSPGGSDAEDLYRILIYDGGGRNLISYGDVRIGQAGTP
ncbi:hypothetical protein SAMN05443144_11169 [Fodinibius roseus]|uniref:Lipoprotein n=1 Tax=Fodinibius roseus TaxID=1194090 RepID=A0A1M5DC92_9BACT|nr:hypothetical protein [Fodinibius roseus]SHF64567.1 hypothetical protein SAMN05443144_11169 [Fodinibius roseus]